MRSVAGVLSLRPGEVGVTLLSTLAVFTFFLGYGGVKPLRDAMGIERGADKLVWLMTATLVASFMVSPVISWAMRVFGSDAAARRKLPVRVYRFFAANVVLFALARWVVPEDQRYKVGYVFYVWASVFNLTCVGAFWSLMADVFPRERSLRAFGVIAVGATLGLIAGAWAAERLGRAGASPLVFMGGLAVLLEVAARLLGLVGRGALGAGIEVPAELGPVSSGARGSRGECTVLAGLGAVVSSRYLMGVCVYLLIYSVTSTFFYLVQQRVIGAAGADTAARTAMNASIDFWANSATLVIQLFLTGRIIRVVGQSGALAATPLVTVAGLAWMGGSGGGSGLGSLTQAVVTRRSVHYAVDRPGREALYTVIPPEQKYTAKSFIDTFIYRGGDALGAWVETAMKASNLPVLWVAGPMCAAGAVLGVWLGRRAAASAGGAFSQPAHHGASGRR